jgi:hypothetical protein
MYDAGKVITGLALFLGIGTFPAWYGAARGVGPKPPELALPKGEKQCVESKEEMRARHMELLDEWRDSVVRGGEGVYTSRSNGKKHAMKLTGTCLSCHGDRAQFCDKCHAYLAVEPTCWSCHITPPRTTSAGASREPPVGTDRSGQE